MQTLPRKFNPGLNQDDECLIEQYVVRLPLLKILLETIADNTESPICQHRLYYGPRGRGKTMLMTRVAAELKVNSTFSENWIPIRLLEESYYEISNIGEFWLEVMSELTLSLSTEYKESAELSLKYLTENWSHPNLEQMAQATVLDLLDKLDKKAVIMIENLHQLIDETNDDFGWTIRRVMQNEPRIMFLVTATTRFDNLDNAKKPFFEIFATTELKRLKRSDVAILWNALTQSNKTEQEIAPLDILTGGSPRLLNIVAQFAQKNSIRELMENLTGLVDEYTEYFKSQLDSLAPKERRVFLALADLWSESTAKEVAERARMDIRTASALLGRLEHKGALKVNADQPRRKLYSVAERLFCIYYKLRRERSKDAVIEGLVQFMVDFYTPEEIDEIRVFHLSKDSLTEEENTILDRLSIVNNKLSKESPMVKERGRVLERELNHANNLYYKGDYDGAIIGYQKVIEQYNDQDKLLIVTKVINAMFNEAVAYGRKGSVGEALASYQNIIDLYQSREEVEIAELVIKAMIYHLIISEKESADRERTLAGYESIINKYQSREEVEIVEMLVRLMGRQGEVYGEQGNIEKEFSIYNNLIKKYKVREEPQIVYWVAETMVHMARAYDREGQAKKAIVEYETLIKRYQARNESEIASVVNVAALNIANIYARGKQWKKAEESYQQTLLFHNRDITSIDQIIINSTASIGRLISKQAQALSNVQQTGLSKVISEANKQSVSEERMALAIGVAAVLPAEMALSIILGSIGHEALQPLVVVLQQDMGEKLRTSEEILEVAVDVRKRMLAMREKFCPQFKRSNM